MEENNLYTQIMPPTIQDVKIYFSQKGMLETEAESFFLFYEKRGWRSKRGNYFKTWKNVAYQWIGTIVSNQPLLFDKTIH
jgi:hypothetical protein